MCCYFFVYLLLLTKINTFTVPDSKMKYCDKVINSGLSDQQKSECMLRIAKNCLLNDFDIDTIIVYLKSGNRDEYNKNHSLMDRQNNTMINLKMNERSSVFLLNFEQKLKKYINLNKNIQH
jgi:hypothetical protein